LLVPDKDRDRFLSRLRKAGVLHIKHVKEPVSHEVDYIDNRLQKIGRMVETLSEYYEEDKALKDGMDHEKQVWDCCLQVEATVRDLKEVNAQMEALQAELAWYSEWGAADPEDIAKIEKTGIKTALYKLSSKDHAAVADRDDIHLLHKKNGLYYVILISAGEPDLRFEKVDMPERSPEQINARMDDLNNRRHVLTSSLREKARHMRAFRHCRDKLASEKEFVQVRSGMKGEEGFSYMQGFCPEKHTGRVTAMIKEEGAGYLIEDPDDTDHPPTLITNPAWIRIIDPVFKFMNTLPGYREYDISPYFLIFFSVFFAMLIGDAGYGTLFLGVTWVLRRKFKKAPAQPFFLMYLLSVCTMIWGAITGTWFGIEKVAELPFFNALVIPQIDSFSSRSQNSVIFICFVIGAVQLSIARIIKVARYINSPLAVAEAGWVFILWGMFFAAGRFVLGRVFPSFAFWLLGGGILMVLFFSDPRKGWIKGALSTLADLPLSVIGSFSDIVSYLRLFAVGYASVVVAQSFNNMAVGGGVDSIAGSLMAALVLFLGHALNIILGFMAVIVHGIRLNMLEFSGHLGMQWTGKKYDPFRSK
jgi:V/A-type H+-transporting ATPase subunit I